MNMHKFLYIYTHTYVSELKNRIRIKVQRGRICSQSGYRETAEQKGLIEAIRYL